MKKALLSLVLAFSLIAPAAATTDPFAAPPKNMRAADTMQINSVPAVPAPPSIAMEDVVTEDTTHAAATPDTTAATGPSTWLALAIGLLLVSIGGVFGLRMSRK